MARQTPTLSFGMCVLLLVVALSSLLLPFGGAGSLDRAEPYFMDAARAMVERGDWLVPFYRDQPFFDKPILGYWVIGLCFRLFGYSAEAARIGPALFAILTLVVTIMLGVLVGGRRVGLFAGVALATTVPFVTFGRTAMADMPMTFFSTAAVVLALVAWSSRTRRDVTLPALGAALGLGFAAKGPIAVLLPGLAILALAWHRRREKPPLALGPLLLAALLFAMLGFGWFLAVYVRFGSEPLRYFFLQENLQRFAGSTYDAERSPFYYLAAYLSQGLPWSLFLPAALIATLRPRVAAPTAGVRWIPLALLLMVLLLSVSRGKLDYYLLPLYPLACVLVGAFFASQWERLAVHWSRAVCALVGCASLVAALFARPPFPEAWLPSASWRAITAAMAVTCALALALAAWRPNPARVAGALALPTGLLLGLFTYVWAPAFQAQQPNHAIVRQVERELALRPDARLALCADPVRVHRDLLFETPIKTLESCELWSLAASREPFLILLRPPEWHALRDARGLRVVGGHLYLPANALSGEGLLQTQRAGQLVLVANYATSDPAALRVNRRWRRGASAAR
jgi:4-amino-4-deoxy-L-arabinose transferase-like glycosyltransferase